MSTSPSVQQRLRRFLDDLVVLREGALDQLDGLFTEDVRFRDPFRETSGLPAFRETFVRMFKQYPTVGFDDFRWDGDEQAFTLRYTMRLRMAVGPTLSVSMVTLGQTRDGRICEYTDYFDLLSSLLSPIPLLQAGYRRLIARLFL